MLQIKQLISEFQPTIYINNKKYESLDVYLQNADYTNNKLHSYYYNKKENRILFSFISEYAMKKIMGEV
jgi:hypothetical protein